MRCRERVPAPGGVVEVAQQAFAAAIRHLVENRAVAARDVLGLDQEEVGVELDQAVGIAGRKGDVGDHSVGRRCGGSLCAFGTAQTRSSRHPRVLR